MKSFKNQNTRSLTSDPSLISLKELFQERQILQNEKDLKVYGKDWLSHFKSNPSLVIFPEKEKDVQKLVLWARQWKKKLVPSGGRTGLSGGATASQKEIVVSFERMNRILSFDPILGSFTCEAGVITEQVQNYVEKRGFFFPIHFSAQGSSQIGGNIATNAGGIKVIRFGLIRNWVMNLKVITGKGEIVTLGRPLIKEASGYDLKQLFIGSEGTLGFILEATLRCAPKPKKTHLLFLALDKLSSVLPLFQRMRKSFRLSSFEFMTDSALQKVVDSKSTPLPFESTHPFYLLVEVEDESEKTEEKLFSVYEEMDKEGWVKEGLISQSSQQTKEFWALRENISECLAPFSPYKNDISLPLPAIPSFIEELEQMVQTHYPKFQVLWFGHIGDGNLHINILKPDSLEAEEFLSHCKKVDPLVFELVQKKGGSISAEHGVGLLKKPFLSFSREPEEIRLMKEIKKIFDPDGIMNPGKILDL